MKASVLIPLPVGLCELAAAERLRNQKGVLSAHMVRAGEVTAKYNPKKIKEGELIKQATLTVKPCKKTPKRLKLKQPLAA